MSQQEKAIYCMNYKKTSLTKETNSISRYLEYAMNFQIKFKTLIFVLKGIFVKITDIVQEAHTQHPQYIKVQSVIATNRIMRSYFLKGILIGERYFDFLQSNHIPVLTLLIHNSLHPDLLIDQIFISTRWTIFTLHNYCL